MSPEKNDGVRISVMSRHALNNGKTLDVRINKKSYKIHTPSLGPSPKLIGSYYKKDYPLSWDQFQELYLWEIRNCSKKINLVKIIARLALTTNVTLLCIEKNAIHCHRRLLAEECVRIDSKLTITHL
jgi:uncharacterized protein YeaO (DUF488 family)